MALQPASKPADKSLNNQQILSEDEYTEGLAHIIARDFFPGLNPLQAMNEYFDAIDSNDFARIDRSVRRMRQLDPTPRAYGTTDTPLRTPAPSSGAGSSKKRGRKRKHEELEGMGLDEYQARFTSEDNASFTEILDDENEKRKERYKWAWDAQKKAMDTKMITEGERTTMLLEGGGEKDGRGVGVRPGVRGRIEVEHPDVLMITEGEESRDGSELALQAIPSTSEPPQDVMAPTKDTRTPFVGTWKFKTRNGLMFSPDADSSPYHVKPDSAMNATILTASDGIQQPKSITHGATRLPSPPPEALSRDASNLIPPSPTRSRIDAAIAGLPYRSSDPSNDEEAAKGPNGYNYVPTVPSPSPDALGPIALKELMTMGTLLSTPRVLSSTRDDAAGAGVEASPFRINDPSRREMTGLRLSAKASKSIREKASMNRGTPRVRGDMGPPGATPRRGGNDLTPAARALLERSMGGSRTPGRSSASSSSAGPSSVLEKDLRKVKWTPSPVTRR